MCRIIACFVLTSEIETDYLSKLFTKEWLGDSSNTILSEAFACAENYLRDVFKLCEQEIYASKVVDSFY